MNPDNDRINPDIKEVKIGIRRLRKIKVYPLSAADQFKMTDILNEGLQKFTEMGDLPNAAFVAQMMELIRSNIGTIFGLVTDAKDRGENILEELTNNQIAEIAEVIYEVNYKTLQKKVTSLLEKVTGMLPSGRLSPIVSEDTLNTISPIISEEVSSTGASPLDRSPSSTSVPNENSGII